MSKKHRAEYENIVNNIINTDRFKELDNELHHGITRYGHSCRVARCTYRLAKTLKLDYVSATRGAILHDFYLDSDFNDETSSRVFAIHPDMAANNAKKMFDINAKEENIIASHMFPVCKVKPKYKESWLVTCVDKGVAMYEMYRYKFSLIVNIWAIFLFNMITINK